MQFVRRLFIGTMTLVGVLASIAVAILVVNHYRSESVLELESGRATAWENLGDSFDFDLPTEREELPGLARVVDPNLADGGESRDVFDEELRDATTEEREIWRAELARHSPEEVREILGLHRRLSSTLGHAHVGDVEFVAGNVPAPRPMSEVAIASANRISTDPPVAADAPAATDALGLIDSAIEASRSAELVILNNIANANTVGFKRSRALFGELPYRQVAVAGHIDAEGNTTSNVAALGDGVCLTTTQADVSQGRLRHTQRQLDIAIQGEGYFQIIDGDSRVYTRTGSFALNANGEMALNSKDRSRLLEPTIKLPADATKVVISSIGAVSVIKAGDIQPTQIGQLQLCRFANPEALAPRGENLFGLREDAGNPVITTPGQDGLGELRQGALEESNVVVGDELAELRRIQEQLKTLRQLQAEFSGTSRVP